MMFPLFQKSSVQEYFLGYYKPVKPDPESGKIFILYSIMFYHSVSMVNISIFMLYHHHQHVIIIKLKAGPLWLRLLCSSAMQWTDVVDVSFKFSSCCLPH